VVEGKAASSGDWKYSDCTSVQVYFGSPKISPTYASSFPHGGRGEGGGGEGGAGGDGGGLGGDGGACGCGVSGGGAGGAGGKGGGGARGGGGGDFWMQQKEKHCEPSLEAYPPDPAVGDEGQANSAVQSHEQE
jgi:hypothetical protein